MRFPSEPESNKIGVSLSPIFPSMVNSAMLLIASFNSIPLICHWDDWYSFCCVATRHVRIRNNIFAFYHIYKSGTCTMGLN